MFLKIQNLKIKNFRSLLNTGIRIAPITLIFGKNNSGKSNFLKAFRLMQQSFSHSTLQMNGNFTKLGSFIDTTSFRNNKSIAFEYGFIEDRDFAKRIKNKSGTYVELKSLADNFSFEYVYNDILKENILGYVSLKNKKNDKIKLKYRCFNIKEEDKKKKIIWNVPYDHLKELVDLPEYILKKKDMLKDLISMFQENIFAVRCEEISTEKQHWELSYTEIFKNKNILNDLIKLLELKIKEDFGAFSQVEYDYKRGEENSYIKNFLYPSPGAKIKEVKDKGEKNARFQVEKSRLSIRYFSLRYDASLLHTYIDFLKSSPSIDQYISYVTNDYKTNFLEYSRNGREFKLNKFVPAFQPGRNFITLISAIFDFCTNNEIKKEWGPPEDLIEEYSKGEADFRKSISTIKLQRIDKRIFEVRERPQAFNNERIYQQLNINPALVDSVNKYLSKLQIGFNLVFKSIKPSEDFFQIFLKDIKNKFEVNLIDTGQGLHVSLIPLITHCLASRHKIIVFEEPEQNLHPSLEASLADLLVESYKKRQNQFVIETHSEHLVIGLLKQIKDKTITNEQVSINFAEIKSGETIIKEIPIDKSGNLKEWPEGFLPDTLDII